MNFSHIFSKLYAFAHFILCLKCPFFLFCIEQIPILYSRLSRVHLLCQAFPHIPSIYHYTYFCVFDLFLRVFTTSTGPNFFKVWIIDFSFLSPGCLDKCLKYGRTNACWLNNLISHVKSESNECLSLELILEQPNAGIVNILHIL